MKYKAKELWGNFKFDCFLLAPVLIFCLGEKIRSESF